MGQLRQRAKTLSARAKAGDPAAARELLAHSVELGHRRLSLRRFFLAHALGAEGLHAFRPYCETVAAELPPEDITAMAADARTTARRAMAVGHRHGE
ncbi:MAG: hypothetical protein AAFX39_04615 [Pseudomonadota bacterium]